jgi:hypothetical protein
MKRYLILLLLVAAAALLSADAMPETADYYKVKVTTQANTETIGYIEVYPYYLISANKPADYSLQAVKQGQEMLPLIQANFRNKPHNDVLTVYTALVNWKQEYFFVKEGIHRIPFEQISSIVALQEIKPHSLFDDSGSQRIMVHWSAILDEAAAKLIRKGVLYSLYGNFKEKYASLLLLSTNPNYTQTDLYLYACLMSGTDEDGKTDYLEDIHPILSAEEVEDEKAVIWGFVHDLDVSQVNRITTNLKKSSETWKKMAEYLQNSQSIQPDAKADAITALRNAAASAADKAAELSLLTASELREKSDSEKQTLYNSIVQCLVPQFNFPSRFSLEEWKPYLLKRGIVCVEYAHIP